MKRLIHSFTVRKVMELLLTLLIVTFLSFLLVKLSPVDAAEAYARRTFMLYTPEQLDALREKMGLNQPLLVQYGTWIRNALHIELAETFSYDPEKAATLLDEAGWVMNEKTGIREKNGEALNLTYIYDTAQDALASSYATLLKSQLEKVGIGLELKGSEKMEWYAGIMAGSFDITYWIGEYEFSSPHCFFGAMASMTPHTFSLSQVNGSQEFFDAISTVKQTADPTEVQNLYNYLINYDLGNVIDIPLTYYKDMILYNTNKIAGYEFSGVPTFFDVKGLQPVA